MHPLLDNYLCKKYPKIFAERNLPMTQTCMCWGFAGDGWFLLLDNLCHNIQRHIDNPGYLQKKCLWNVFVRLWIDWVWNRVLFPLHIRWSWVCPKWKYEKKVIPQVVAHQVKEKFGTLRFYYSGGDDEIRGMVDFAESLTYHICEDCGRFHNDVGQTPGWIHTVCPKCVSSDPLRKKNREAMDEYRESRNLEVLDILEKIKKEHKK